MTPIAKVRSAKAEPQRYWAAESTLKVDVVRPVFLALGHPSTNRQGGASGAEEFVFFKYLHFLISGLDAVFESAEVGFLALVAGVVGHFEEVEFVHGFVAEWLC